MRTYSRRQKITCLALSLLLLGAVLVAAPSNGTLRFSRAALTVDDLAAVYGLNIYKFDLHTTGPQQYRVVLREKLAADQPWRNLFAEELSAPGSPTMTLSVSFTRRDGSFGGVLSGDEEVMDFSVKLCDENRCYAGMSTTLPVPLAGCEGIVRFVHNSEAEVPESGPNAVRLFTMKPSTQQAAKSGDTQHPRAELLLERIPPQ